MRKCLLPLVFFISLFLTVSVVLSSDEENYEAVDKAGSLEGEESVLPEAILSFGDSGGEIVLVEKTTQRLHVYGKAYQKVGTFVVTTGENQGDKMTLGDKKTPEGVYFFTDLKEEKELFPEYGVMALVTDYPNPIDMARQKNGSGIWLHATNQPERPLTPRDTRGCVVGVNEDILNVARHIDLEMTPFVIVDKIRYVPQKQILVERAKVSAFLSRWKESWETKNIDSYISSYSEQFRSKGMTRLAWKNYKERLNKRYGSIKVGIEDVKIVKSNGYLVATFIQNYQSDSFKDRGVKKIYIVDEPAGLKILGEEWREIPTKKPKIVADDYLQKIAMRQQGTLEGSEGTNFKPLDKAL